MQANERARQQQQTLKDTKQWREWEEEKMMKEC